MDDLFQSLSFEAGEQTDIEDAAEQLRKQQARSLEGEGAASPISHVTDAAVAGPSPSMTPSTSPLPPVGGGAFLGEQDQSPYGPESREAVAFIDYHLLNPETSEIHLNGPDSIFIKVQGKIVQAVSRETGAPIRFSNLRDYERKFDEVVWNVADVGSAVAQAARRQRELIESRRVGVFSTAQGFRAAVFLPPVSGNGYPAACIVKRGDASNWRLHDLVSAGTLTPEMAEFLRVCIQSGVSIMVCGGMGSGKTTLLDALVREIPQEERIVVIEEVGELSVHGRPNAVPLRYFPEKAGAVDAPLSLVLDVSLYGRFSRVIVGEIHTTGISYMLRAMTLSENGSLSTFHASNASVALSMIRDLYAEERKTDAVTAAANVRNAIDLVVIIDRLAPGVHRIIDLAEVQWQEMAGGSTKIGTQTLWRWDGDIDDPTKGEYICVSAPQDNGSVLRKARRKGVVVPVDNLFAVRPGITFE